MYCIIFQALLFLTELADKNTNWFIMYRELLRERQILTVLSAALYTGPEDIKKRVLSLTGSTGFSSEWLVDFFFLLIFLEFTNKLIILFLF